MTTTKYRNLSWNDRFALIAHFEPSTDQILQSFDISIDEWNTAVALKESGTFVPTKNIDVELYSGLFTTSPPIHSLPPIGFITSPSNHKGLKDFLDKQKPQTASKIKRPPRKPGRKGDKIKIAFESIPLEPTCALSFAKKYNVSLAVLRQSKRFDKTGGLPVSVRKDKSSGKLMIWRKRQGN